VYVGIEETIVAVSSPAGYARRGLIRISGSATVALLQEIMSRGSVPETRGITSVDLTLLSGGPLRALLLFLPGPGSYTGEDTAELIVPGNPLLLDEICRRLCTAGAAREWGIRPARAGEFTARAFLNGRLSAADADTVAHRIAATREEELHMRTERGEAALFREAARWKDAIADVLAAVEAGIDFSDEEDVVVRPAGVMHGQVGGVVGSMRDLLRDVGSRERAYVLPRVVISGPPNAGKSTLFNRLLGHDRVVTSSLAGSTRDTIEEPCVCRAGDRQITVLLIDTAGETEAQPDALERGMMASRAGALRRADLVLECRPCARDDRVPAASPAGLRIVRVGTKCDRLRGPCERPHGWPHLCVSARSGEGIEALCAQIIDRLEGGGQPHASADRAIEVHDLQYLERAVAALDEAHRLLATDHAAANPARPEVLAQLLRSSLDQLGAVAGEEPPDAVLGRIFATFCIGK